MRSSNQATSFGSAASPGASWRRRKRSFSRPPLAHFAGPVRRQFCHAASPGQAASWHSLDPSRPNGRRSRAQHGSCPTPPANALAATAHFSCDIASSVCRSALSGSVFAKRSTMAREARKLASAAKRLPWVRRASPIFSCDTARSRCQSAFSGSASPRRSAMVSASRYLSVWSAGSPGGPARCRPSPTPVLDRAARQHPRASPCS